MAEPEQPLVSVLVSVYNGEPYIRATLAGILGQGYGRLEVLALDDGSTDGTWQALNCIADEDARLHLLRHEQNQGVPLSVNRLFKEARGQYIVRHDADDLSLPQRFSKQVQFLEANAAVGLAGTKVQLIDPAGQPLDRSYFPELTTNADLQAALLRSNCFCQGSVMFRQRLLGEVGDYELDNVGSEDYDLWLRMAEITQVAVLDEVLYQYRIHPTSLSHRRRHEQTYYAARSLERALVRRFAQPIPRDRLDPAAGLYLEAAIGAWASGSADSARQWLQHALQLVPEMLSPLDPLTRLVRGETTKRPVNEGLLLVRSLFTELLPRTPELKRLQGRLSAELHMRAVFFPVGTAVAGQRDQHLWQGVAANPAWLRNRGVLALLGRSAARRIKSVFTPSSKQAPK